MFENLTKIFSEKTVTNVQDSLDTVNPLGNMSNEQRRTLSDQFEVVATFLLLATIFLAPLIFLPILADSFDLPRQSLLFALTLAAAVVYLLKQFTTDKPTITRSIFDLPIAAFAAAAIISALLSSNKFTALAADPVVFVTLTVFFLLLTQTINKAGGLTRAVKFILASGAVLSIWSAVQFTYSFFGPKLAIPATLIPYLSPTFSPTGSILSQAVFLAILIPLGIGLFYQTIKKQEKPLIPLLLLGANLLGLSIVLYSLFNNRPIVLPANAGWKIATGTLGQSLTGAFFGTGPAHFIDSFTLYKPIDFNNTPLWNLRFVTSSNFYFYLLTTTGIIGLASFLWLVIRILKTAKKRLDSGVAGDLEKGIIGSLLLCLGLFLVLPAPAVTLFTFATVLALFSANLHLTGNTKIAYEDSETFAAGSWQRPVFTVVTLTLFLGGGYFLGRLVLADYHFANSLKAALANRGTETYNEQIAALILNPNNDSYRVSYSQTNLALANALAAQPNLSDQQKQTVLALVQQSIREGRNAVALTPSRASDWENLSLIYRNLINFAQGADQFAIASQNVAISFDPTNPRLRLDLGGIYFSLKDFQSAGQAFAQAVNLKPDYANAHYNLSQALKELKMTDQALQQLQATSTLVCVNKDSADCQKVTAEIAALGEKPASPSASAPAENPLSTPSAKSNLPKAATKPPATISSPSGEITP